MAALLKLVPESQVTFGSDYPYVPIDAQLAALGKLGLSSSAMRAIESGNARRFIPGIPA
jgi:predicted TIM-barrel fold metal-dependent hydrolase